MGELMQFAAAAAAPQPEGCSACGGRRWIEIDRSVMPCACQAEERNARRLSLRGVPSRYQRCTRETWRGRWPAPEGLDMFAGKPWVVVVMGPRGTGKTHFATVLWDSILTATGRQGCWYSVADSVRQIQSEFGLRDAGGRELSPTRDRLYSDGLLLLDDLGFEKQSDYVRQLVAELLHHRHMNEHPTILTSNALSVEAFDAIDPRITSRLHESAAHVHLSGADCRLA